MSPQITELKNCFGCGVCAKACPKKIIDIQLDKDGFYRPYINELESCIGCHLCDEVCAFLNPDTSFPSPEGSYALWSSDDNTRMKCSSGGASLEIARHLISKGYKFCGVKYNVQKDRAEHFIASTPDEAESSCGSKYIQSYTPDALNAIDIKQKYLVTGTPCQIASFRKYIRRLRCEDNFILMDFYCHSVPSMLCWKYYLRSIKKKYGKVESVTWRDKENGWHNSYRICVNYDNQDNPNKRTKQYCSNYSQRDLFYRLFLGDFCSNKSCAKSCIYKYNNSKADIRIGDLWGETFRNDEKGVSGVIAFTSKGESIIKELSNCIITPLPVKTVAEGQMKSNIRPAEMRGVLLNYLKTKHPNIIVIKSIIFTQRVLNRIKRIFK